MKQFSFILLLCCHLTFFGQEYFPKNDGVSNSNNNYTAFTNATIYINAIQKIENGTLLIRDGKVLQVGPSINLQANTQVINLEGHFIYPSFVDAYSDFGIAKPQRSPGF